ncbi:MAG: DNA primase [Myxococcota bacterium]
MSIRIDDALLQQVRDRNNIVQVVGDYVSLRKAGSSYKGLCPFHNERTPSFHVHEDRQFFYCFGCQTGGDVITFVREHHGYGFVEAVRHLAERAGITLPEGPAAGGDRPSGVGGFKRRKQKESLFAINRAAQEFFQETLQGLQGDPCRAYVRERRLNGETVKRFGLGFAPDAWEALSRHLAAAGFSVKLAETAGLVAPRKSGSGHYDRFRNRLVFPIRNLAGETIAFGGRALPSPEEDGDRKPAKYINSPETPVYDKGRTLFGLHEARRAIRQVGEAVVVEGNVDVLMLSQAGIEHVVAPMGTALTPEQCQRLRRMAERVVLLYDGDSAGRAAALKAVPAAMAEGMRVSVATLPDGEDPDSFVAERGADALREVMAAATPGWDYVVEHALEELRFDEDPRAAAPRAVDRLAPVLRGIDDRRERLLRQRGLAQRLGLDERTLADFLRQADFRRRGPTAPGPTGPVPAPPPRPAEPPPPNAEIQLLVLVLLHPDARLLYMARDLRRTVTSERVRDAIERLLPEGDGEPRHVDPAAFIGDIEDPELKGPIVERLREPVVEDWKASFENVVGILTDRRLRRDSGSMRRRVSDATDEEEQLRAIRELRALAAKREQIKGS